MNANAPAHSTRSGALPGSGLGLGMDWGGTQTRWAVADASGTVCREGTVAGLSGLLLADEAGRAQIAIALRAMAAAAGPVHAVWAGITGYDAQHGGVLRDLASVALGVAPQAVRAMNDIELACHAAWAPGQGHVIYAGTGSIAAHVDAAGVLHRAGGRGHLIDDGGSGVSIALQALRAVWRAEDENPGAWQHSALAQRLFARLGGSDWLHSRSGVYGASRGELGLLALAAAEAAQQDQDAQALAILRSAGSELARLGRAMLQRCGALPIALAGRVPDLHPLIEQTLRAELPTAAVLQRVHIPAHHAAAVRAAGDLKLSKLNPLQDPT